ncbi:hypothetical protein [uncultured Tateyamaria sp.]|uniref:hypothetical protein n=1 Tax=uncultured Tateyamaria sp. TaxID=455651 RepID=UPI002617FD32|nr:hypothetical protein [uncultured Tateyamaria sp.]
MTLGTAIIPQKINPSDYPQFPDTTPTLYKSVAANYDGLRLLVPHGDQPTLTWAKAYSFPTPSSPFQSIPSDLRAVTYSYWSCLMAEEANITKFNFTNTVTQTVTDATTKTISGTLGVKGEGVEASVTATYSVANTVTSTTTETIDQGWAFSDAASRIFVVWQLRMRMGIAASDEKTLFSYDGIIKENSPGYANEWHGNSQRAITFNAAGNWIDLPVGRPSPMAYDISGNALGGPTA